MSFVKDLTKKLIIPIDSIELLQIIELMLEKDYSIIATINILNFLKEHKNEIKASGILTEQESEILDEIFNNYDDLIKAYDLLEEYKKEMGELI